MSEPERNPALDAAWRAASREEPPVALDEAIRAAARRAVDAAPRRQRGKHWWYPLAAAATVAVIAIGLLQLTPPEQVAPTVVGDMSGVPQMAQREDLAKPPQSAQGEDAGAAAKRDALEQKRRQASGTGAGSTQSVPVKPEASAAKEVAPAEPPRSKPFPAEPSATAPPTVAPVPAPESLAPRSRAFPAAPPTAAPSTAALAQRREAAVLEAQAMRDQAAPGGSASAQLAKLKSPPRGVDDWIKLIRRLRDEGRLAEAAKELSAFRDAYGERADSLLPPDLREFKPQEPTAGAK